MLVETGVPNKYEEWSRVHACPTEFSHLGGLAQRAKRTLQARCVILLENIQCQSTFDEYISYLWPSVSNKCKIDGRHGHETDRPIW